MSFSSCHCNQTKDFLLKFKVLETLRRICNTLQNLELIQLRAAEIVGGGGVDSTPTWDKSKQ